MPKLQVNLTGPPFPLGNSLETIRRGELYCIACCNLYPATALALMPRHGLEMQAATGPANMKAAERVGALEPIPMWILRVTTYYVYADDSDSEGSIFMTAKMGTPMGLTVLGTNVDEIEIYTLPGQRSPWPTIGSSIPFARRGEIYQSRIGGVARHVTSNPGSEAGFSLIKSWLSQCVNAHASYREADSKAEHKLPKRVIEVGSDDNTAIRLYEHDDRPDTLGSHYVALSHCWGRKPLPRLTIDTVEKKKVNVPWESLPKTFQDVILVARGIDVEYVWIDSLCIIQDDEQDWETEAAKMSLIYEGALMVMAATASGDSSGGCLFEREQYLEIQATIQPGEHFRATQVHFFHASNTPLLRENKGQKLL
ncbi:hypothetical protein NUW58_g6358 [Xylaria curta]|uniref:Uncharacterized protein n=1 Tax=Xylaria curta TaxID=42375 RepID=A0ACC1NVA1_9PEZI|nr:hypothetical protein NUW58_g6358 [Xylaria curta]